MVMWVGRIAAIRNNLHNEFYKDRVGFFGMFECIDNQAIANALLDTAAEWIKKENLDIMRGPMNYSFTESQALLIENYDEYSAPLMTYNPPYYKCLLETYGLIKQVDLYAYTFDLENVKDKLATQLISQLTNKGIIFRNLNIKQRKQESPILCNILNEYEAINLDNFYPISELTVQYFMKKVAPIMFNDMAILAEDQRGVIGFACGIPDYHEYFKNMRNGRLIPEGVVQFIKLKIKPPKRFKFMLCGVTERAKNGFIASGLISLIIERALKHGFREMDMSLIHEDNAHMQRICQSYGGRRYKTYRVYERRL